MRRCWLAALALLCLGAQAEGNLFNVPTRPGVSTALFWESADQAKATVLLMPGGAGGFGKVEQGRATGQNFLVRSTAYFLANGLNVAIMGRPSDTQDLDYADRTSEAHLTDVRQVLAFVKAQSAAPVWLVGTSRGTVSATAAAIALRHDPAGAIAGLVLSSSVVSDRKPGAVPTQNLAAIEVPVLVFHHARDACWVCNPGEVPAILRGLTRAPIKKEILVQGGANPRGDACGALHWHGYIGMEREAADTIARWVLNPVN